MTTSIQPPSTPTTPLPRSTRSLWFEVGTVLLVCIVPLFYGCIAWLYSWDSSTATPAPFWYEGTSIIVQSVGHIALVLYLIRASGEPTAHFGLTRFDPRSDLLNGLGVLLLGMMAASAMWLAIRTFAHHDLTGWLVRHDLRALSAPSGGRDIPMLLAMCLVNGIREELVMRAYFIQRFEQLFASTWAALLLSTAIFAGYHLYQGPAGVMNGIAIGLAYGFAFCRFRRFWPLALAHAFQDIWSIGTMGLTMGS